MGDRSIASRPTMEQVIAIVEFMEKHPLLALGQLRGGEGRDEGKKLWLKLTKIVNDITGPTRTMKSWIKFWADKKSTVRAKVLSAYGDANTLTSHVDKKIWDLFLANDCSKCNISVKNSNKESRTQEHDHNEDSMIEQDMETPMSPSKPVLHAEDRQMAVMEKLVKVMESQASAMSQLAAAARASAHASSTLADAAHDQASALIRIATAFESSLPAVQESTSAILAIDNTMKQFCNPLP